MKSARFDVVTVVWGPEYRQLFVDVCIPNQLSEGNLGSLPAGSRYRIFTSADDAAFLRSSPRIREARDVIPVDIVVEPEVARLATDRFKRMTACHAQALREAAESGVGLIFLSPDLVMSEGTLAAVVRRHEAGSRAVVCAGIRLNRREFVAAMRARGVRGLPARELTSLALDHLHAFTRAHMIDAPRTASSPISVYWNVLGEGILVRPLFLHPLMIDPVCRDVMPETTVDAKFVARACPTYEQVHVVTDSDELSVFELSDADGAVTDTAPGGIAVWRAATMFASRDSHQKRYWSSPIRIHAHEIGPAWTATEKESARFARRVVRFHVPIRWMGLTVQRLKRLQRDARWSMKRARKAARPLSPARVRRARVLATRRMQQLGEHTVRTVRTTVRRAYRSTMLLTHSVARPVQKLRKRTARVGRRVLRRARVGL